MLPTKQLSV